MSNIRRKVLDLFMAAVPVLVSALGGAFMVFSSYDDSPGGSLIGFVLILVSLYLVTKRNTESK
jgi:hypothetical protein